MMASNILLLFLGLFLVSHASTIPEGPPSSSDNEAVISSDVSLAVPSKVDDEIPSKVKFDIAKLVRELLDKLRGILEKLLDFAEVQFRKALDKADGVIRKIEDMAKSKIAAIAETVIQQTGKIINEAAEKGVDVSHCIRAIEEQFQISLEQLLQELNGKINKAFDEETVKMRDSLDKINETIGKIEIEPCAGSPLVEFECWTKELSKVTKALLYIPTEVSKQIAQTLLDIGSLSFTIVSTAKETIKRAESIGIQVTDDLKKCIPDAE